MNMLKIQKLSVPGTMAKGTFVANIFKDGKFKVGYCYSNLPDYSRETELEFLRNRFPDWKGYTIIHNMD